MQGVVSVESATLKPFGDVLEMCFACHEDHIVRTDTANHPWSKISLYKIL